MNAINHLLYQLHVTDQTVTQLFEKRLGISLTRYELLQFLLEVAPCNQIRVQEVLQIDQAALTRHFKILEENGYVTRSRNPDNQREIVVDLTDFTREQLVTSPPRHHVAVKEQMESILSAAESETLKGLLDKLVTGLETIVIDND
ncbi:MULTISPECIES: MarR family winged helix-turn-helix transcriptional regulator [unclassified Streptococcus]|uniref:MarR family winged helix-turn-helix transcriptional regulator n=1 Tax=unclassified Streptococcus TaxID=2608887 RepID=UPI001072E9FD|nr:MULTISPECIES: MarR family winged helix-turn-helix transcriptional regulator [unclassified Streptococcus]MBF0787195.1 winged helix-turn-helix transcriptional regulator [Streptococcus sp. 19428wC2_LYSM12]MCQ9211882.1 MarR family winged helix-turn-helix transcriptional regulator [Streptococcus sp. B01]MCQ9212909.1 MarR family winged helix-turn-helix transcriptional regulator [Streptococcus sp. O1]MCQ9213005.1 MarR family winged helix-turn-helix transcriptional regulator [Streptococcus sp. O1]T